MAKNKDGYTPPTRAEIEAMRAEKMQLAPNGEAGRRERKLLEHYSGAQADLQWIVDNNAWTQLGFDTFTAWYAERVAPEVRRAGLRPTQEFALYVLEQVQADNAILPKQQKLIQREMADLVGVPASTLRRLASRSLPAPNGAGGDLGGSADVDDPAPDPSDVTAAFTQAITDVAGRMAAGPDPTHCEKCGADIPWPDQTGGYLRCRDCDASSLHRQEAVGDDFVGGCVECTRQARIKTAAEGADTVPADGAPLSAKADSPGVPAGTGGGTSPVAGPGNPQDSPAVDPANPPHAGVPAAGGTEQERIEGIGCPRCDFSLIVSDVDPDATLTEMRSHLRSHHDLIGDAAGEALALVRTISPAAATTSLPDGDGDPTPEPEQQPGQDSPLDFGSEGFPSRAETSGHLPHGGVGGWAPADPEPSALTPWALPLLFEQFADRLAEIDVEVIGPMLTVAQIDRVLAAIDRIRELGVRVLARTP
jgi:hypothetical protein